MPDTLNYRFYLPGDEYQIVDLLKENFSRWNQLPDALENWNWKHLNNPWKSVIVVCVDEDKIVGVIHEIELNMKIGDSIHLCHYGDDGAVSSGYRGQGVYNKISSMLREYNINNGVDYRYAATENPVISKSLIKVGARPLPFEISHMVRVKNIDKFLSKNQKNTLFINIGIRVLKVLNQIGNLFNTKQMKPNNLSIMELDKFDNRIDVFWNKVKNSFDYIIEKKVNYLNWKLTRPGKNQVLKIASQKDEIVGFIILGISEIEDYSQGVISDLLVLPDRLDVAELLIKDACRYFENKSVDAIYYGATKDHPYQKLFAKNGFLDASREKSTKFFYFIFNPELDSSLVDKIHPTRAQLNYF